MKKIIGISENSHRFSVACFAFLNECHRATSLSIISFWWYPLQKNSAALRFRYYYSQASRWILWCAQRSLVGCYFVLRHHTYIVVRLDVGVKSIESTQFWIVQRKVFYSSCTSKYKIKFKLLNRIKLFYLKIVIAPIYVTGNGINVRSRHRLHHGHKVQHFESLGRIINLIFLNLLLPYNMAVFILCLLIAPWYSGFAW